MARKILLADDSVTAQNMGRRILTDAGYEVVTVNNGSAALKKLAEQRPDLIVLDVYMPGYGGLEVCQRIKENKETARIPVLLTVGKLEPFKPEEARRVRADAFIVKPFEASELLTALTKLEDKIVPQAEPYKPGRFAKALATVERSGDAESFGDKETGWKDRLIIPGPGGKTSDPEPEIPAGATTAFRDVERNKDFQPAEPKSEFERPIPAGLPSDITPEEIAAITAAAATFGGKIPAPANQAEAVAPPQETSAAATPVVEAVSTSTTEAVQTEPVAVSESTVETPAATFASAPETQPAELPVVAAEVSSAEVSSPVEAVPSTESTIVNTTSAPVEAAVVAESEAAKTESVPTPVKFDALEAEKKRAVSDPEVLAALASLGIPADAVVGSSTSGQTGEEVSVAATVAKAELVAVGATASGPRWMAVATALSPDESSMMLEHEMEKAYAAFAAAAGARTTFAAPVTIAGGNGSSAFSESSSTVSHDSSSSSSGGVVESKPEEPLVAAVPEPVASAQEAVAAEPVKNDPAPASETTTEAVAAGASEPVPVVKEEAAFAAAASASAAPAETSIASESVQAVSSSSQSAGGHDPQREAELAAAWANWKPTHEPAAGSQTTSPEAAATPATQEPEKHESPPTPAPEASSDSTEISSIVDNMLAELKPRLMEEIAKKMGNEKKKDKKNKR